MLVVTPEEMDQVRPRLEAFAAEMLGGLARSDQRAKGELYLRGLMLDGKRKSMQPMAARLGVDHQQLQQFVTSSTWDYVEVRKRVARWADEFIEPEAYVIDDSGFPKDGSDSPGVARMYSGTLGKVGNCQIGVSVHAVTDTASAAINWALFLPESWDDTTTTDADAAAQIRRRRARCKIPDEVRHREKWRLALDMLDQITGPPAEGGGEGGGLGAAPRGPPSPTPATATSPASASACSSAACPTWSRSRAPPAPTRPTPSRPRRPTPAVGDHRSRATATTRPTSRARPGRRPRRAAATSPGATAPASNPANPTAAMRSQFLALRVRPANRDIPRNADGSLPECWLIAEWPPDKAEPTDYWLSNLPADTPLPDLVRLAKIRWRIEHDYRELKDGLGLDHFEGRSYTGWHRHVTLAALAQAFCTQLRNDPKAPAPA